MTTQFFAEELFASGFTDLVSVIPPGAQLSPGSKLPQAALGKVPGKRLDNGLWAGYNWRKHEPTAADVRTWCLQGASFGLRADRFPGVDIDCRDPQLAAIVERAARDVLGPAPVRVGRAPKRLLMYRTDEPFGRMRLWFGQGKQQHLVEILGQGQQYLVDGTHPGTQRPYEWLTKPGTAAELTPITRDQADRLLTELETMFEMIGIPSEREGDGKAVTRSEHVNQTHLLAPSVQLVRDAVKLIPNTNALFPGRDDYLRMGYAIRAAVGEENVEEGAEIFLDWAESWEGNDRFEANDPDTVLADYRRMTGAKAVGWPWLAEKARGFGFNDAVLDFEATRLAPDDVPDEAPEWSDMGLAERVVRRLIDVLRYVPQNGKYLVWEQGRWQPDAELLAEALVVRELRHIGSNLMRQGATEVERARNTVKAERICSAAKATAVTQLVRLHRDIAVSVGALDHDPWLLNTPGGIVDLKTGEFSAPRREALCTKATSVPPDFAGEPTRWLRFLDEATSGDRALIGYLQRLCGYCLTGSTREQHVTFIYGNGGNGKTVFLTALYGVLGDYSYQANMDAFTASANDRHSTEIAAFHGARLVSASETQAGRRWDEARVKSLSGGDPITARFMRQDFFTFIPQFKLLFVGNHKPEIRNVDKAMRRRIQMVNFQHAPKVIDPELGAKLREEWPAILAWMVTGCLEWQQQGLNPPLAVQAATEEYFDDQDTFGAWARSCVTLDPAAHELTQDLWISWEQWCNGNGLKKAIGNIRSFGEELQRLGATKWQESGTRRRGYAGVRLNRQEGGIA